MYRRIRRQLARAAALRKLSVSRCALAEAAGLLKRVVSGGGKGVALEVELLAWCCSAASSPSVAAGVQSCFHAPMGLLPTFESMTPRRLSEARAVRTARVRRGDHGGHLRTGFV